MNNHTLTSLNQSNFQLFSVSSVEDKLKKKKKKKKKKRKQVIWFENSGVFILILTYTFLAKVEGKNVKIQQERKNGNVLKTLLYDKNICKLYWRNYNYCL